MFIADCMRRIIDFVGNNMKTTRNLKRISCQYSSKKAFAQLPVTIMSAALIAAVMLTSAVGYNLYDSAVSKAAQLRLARALAEDEAERIRSAGYDDVVKIEKPNGKLQNGYVKEITLGKEYREDIGNSVLKHKPVTINVYDSETSFFPLVSVKTEKVSRWYKSGTFDKSDGGIYDETDEEHKGSIKKTGNGTGYVFLKKGAKVNGEVEIYDETNGDIYIYNSIGTPDKKTVIRHVGPATASGYIRLEPTCTIEGTVTLENSSNGGMILANNLQNGLHFTKTGSGTGYLKVEQSIFIGQNVTISNESSGPIIIQKGSNIYSNSKINRTGSSDSILMLAQGGSLQGKTINIEMDNSGKVTLTSSFKTDKNIYYSSSTNKSLTLSGYNLGSSIRLINNSNGALKYEGKAPDNSELIYQGTGAGYLKFAGTLEGKGTIENNTQGYILIGSETILHDNKKITKTGGGTGYLEISSYVDLKGNFTLDNDGSGYCRFYGSTNPITQIRQFPSIADSAYIKAIGKNYGGIQFIYNCDILGSVNLDFSQKPSTYIFWGNNTNNDTRRILQDGFTYTAK